MAVETAAPLWLPLDAPEATLELVGGKGASLARLAAAGLPVPRGFHLTTAAYRRFVAANDLQPASFQALADVTADDPAALERASKEIHARFLRGLMPNDVTAAVAQAYAALGPDRPAVAVRSSATAEDLSGMSFAGQHETYLNLRGVRAVLEAVRACWASLWTARALGYRLRMGIDQQAAAMGVVVQTIVPAEAAGVLFTANPTTGDRDELIVNASYGLGEAVVSGAVTPDSFVLARSNLTVKETVLGAKTAMVVLAADQGTATQAVPEERRDAPALSAGQLRELGALALRVEEGFGGVPQDIEWAVAEGRCWLLQARPMTGLPPAPLKDVRWEPPIPGTKWVRRQVVENMPEPLSPLFEELYLRDGLEHSAEQAWAMMGAPDAINEIVDRPLFITVNGYAYMGVNIRLNWKAVLVLLGAVVTGIPWLFRRGIPVWRDDILPSYLAAVARWQRLDPAAASDDMLLEGMRALARAEAAYWWGATLAIAVAKVSDVVFDGFLSFALPGRGLTSGRFLRGFPSKALEAEAELEAIAARVRGAEELRALVVAMPASRLLDVLHANPRGRVVSEELQGYLDRYGHQIYSLDFAVPTLAGDPTPVLLALKAQVQQPGRDLATRQAAIVQERDRLIETTASALDPLRRKLFLLLLRWAQGLGPYREDALFTVGSAWPALRRLALELGRRLAAAGSLRTPDDVFFLETSELREASMARLSGGSRPDLARAARARRELREARKRLHPPPAVPPAYTMRLGALDLSGRETQRRNLDAGPTLRGFAVSPGKVTAPASVVLSPADFGTMEPGTILVCPTTTPAWTPLFAQARGLITDIGGVAAHGSIIAREYGIPAVMGTGNGTQRIVSGQLVTVDGDAGTVTLL